MNVIIAYLDTMFSPYPQTPRMLEAKGELQAMMEDAYSSYTSDGLSHNEAVGKVITDFGNLDELAPVLGISAEIAPAGSPGSANAGGSSASTAPASKYPPITMQEAEGFADSRRNTAVKLAIAVALFVLCPIPMLVTILIAGENSDLVGLGVIPLLIVVAIGVVLIVGVDQKRSPFKHISEYRFSSNPGVTTWARELERSNERRRSIALQIAITLWILAAAPLIVSALLFPDLGGTGNGSLVGLILTLIFVAAGLLVFLPANWASEVSATVTRQHGTIKEGDTDENERSLIGVISAIYWPLLVVIYLAWSFIGDAWGQSWLVWPIGGVLFGAIAAGSGAIERYRDAKQRG